MTITIITAILLMALASFGLIFLIEERLFRFVKMNDNRWVERLISTAQGFVIGISVCLISLVNNIAEYFS
jgi:hypothetical protein